MPITIAILSSALATVLMASSIGKLRSPRQNSGAFTALRIATPGPVASVVALSVLEAALAVALLTASGAWFTVTALATTALLSAFLIAVVRAQRLGSTDSCHCFGATETTRIGPRLSIRNSLLFAASVVVTGGAVTGGADQSVLWFAVTPLSDSLPGGVVLGAAGLVGAIAWFTAAPAAPAGQPAVAADGREDREMPILFLRGGSREIVDLRKNARNRAQLVVFVKPGCGPCADVLSALDENSDVLSSVVAVSVVYDAHDNDSFEASPPHGNMTTTDLFDIGGASARAMRVWTRRPGAALIATDGSIVEPLARGRDEVLSLIEALGTAAATPGLSVPRES